METVIVLVVSLLIFRLLGALGVARFKTWSVSAAHAMAVMLVMTSSAHFLPDNAPFVPDSVTVMPSQGDLIAIVPPFVPFPAAMVYLTGVLELLGALGLVITKTRRAAGYCLVLLFVLLFPANIYAALSEVPFNGAPATPLWIRIPEQVIFIAAALFAIRATPRLRGAELPASADREDVVHPVG